MQKLKDIINSCGEKNIKTHIRINGVDRGITDFYSREELMEKYSENNAEIVEYEKDYGEGAIAIRRYLAIDVYEN